MPMLALDGVSLFYDEAGRGSPVLLLHGLGSSGRDWELVAPLLARSRRVVVPDVRGHGRSDKPAGRYGVPLFARDVAALVEKLGLGPTHVVGLSMGGMIGFQLAVDRPDLVRSLTVVNSGPDMVPRTLKMAFALSLRVVMLRLLGPRGFARALAPKLFPKPEQAELRRQFEERVAANDPSAYRRATRALIGWSVLARLGEVRCPTLVLGSDRDYTPHAAKQAYVAKLANARFEEIADSGHGAPADQPEKVAAAVERFLGEVEAKPGIASASKG